MEGANIQKETRITLSLVPIPELDIFKVWMTYMEKIMHYVISCLTNAKLFLIEIGFTTLPYRVLEPNLYAAFKGLQTQGCLL